MCNREYHKCGEITAKGENIYLYKNNDESYEYVPAIGSIGGKVDYAISGYTIGGGGNGSK